MSLAQDQLKSAVQSLQIATSQGADPDTLAYLKQNLSNWSAQVAAEAKAALTPKPASAGPVSTTPSLVNTANIDRSQNAFAQAIQFAKDNKILTGLVLAGVAYWVWKK